MNPRHEKRTEYIKLADGSTKITTKSYFEELAQHMEEIEKYIDTSFDNLKQDVEKALQHFTDDGSPKLVITLDLKSGKPRLKKRWVEMKKNYPRR